MAKRKFNQGGFIPESRKEFVGTAPKGTVYGMSDEERMAENKLSGKIGQQQNVHPYEVLENFQKNLPNVQKPRPSGIVSSSEEAIASMPSMRAPGVPRITPDQNEKLMAMASARENAMRDLMEEAQAPMGIRKTIPRQVRRPNVAPAFAKGGSVKSKGIDGCAQRGKTKGKYI
jgi:hypothetical protein